MACAFSGAPRISRIYGTGTVHELGSPGFAELARELSRPSRSPRGHRRRRRPGDARRAATRSRSWIWSAIAIGSSTGRARKGDDGLVEYRASKNALSIDGLAGIAGMTLRTLGSRGARERMDELGVDVLLLSVGPDLPYLTGYEAMPLERLTMLVLPRDGDAAARRAAPRSAARRRRSPTCSRSCRGTRPTTRSRSSRGSSARSRSVPRSAITRGPGSCSTSSARCRAPRSIALSSRAGADPHGQGRRRDRRAAGRGRTRSTRSRSSMRDRPFVGRSELDVHRELVERMLELGHERSNFAIVAAGEHAASPHHEPSADRVDRRR